MENKKIVNAIPEPKVVRKKVYVVEETIFDDGRVNMHRRNDGFSLFELLGIFDFISREVVDIIKGFPIKVDNVKREVVVE